MKIYFKNWIFFVLTGLFLIGLFCVSGNIVLAATDPYVFTRNLTTGVTGDDVLELQKFLNNNGFVLADSGPGSPGNETTKFGALTRTVLGKFQAANKIFPSVGYFGPATRQFVNNILAKGTKTIIPPVFTEKPIVSYTFTRDLESGMTGTDVLELQKFLNNNGFVLADSGPGSVGNETARFGALTRIKLIEFQKANGIAPANGYFGVTTRKFINNKLAQQIKTDTGSETSVIPDTATDNTQNIILGYYSISGSVSGLINSVTIKNNGIDDIIVNPGQSSNFIFSKTLLTGSNYNVTVISHSADQVCYVQNNTGIISNSNISNIKIACGAGVKLFYNPFTTINPAVNSQSPAPAVEEESVNYTVSAISAITGTPQAGYVLTAGSITPSTATVSYQWLIANTSNGTYTEITNATSSSYTVQIGDVGKYIKVLVTGTGACNGSATSTATIAIVGVTIDISTISGVTAPDYGATPVTTITETDQFTGTVSWNPNDNPFSSSTIYTATITLTPKTGYSLTGVAANLFTVASTTSDTNPANSGVITAIFPITESVASFTWTGTGSKSFTLRGTNSASVHVDWGDGNSNDYVLLGIPGDYIIPTHSYLTTPSTVVISGDIGEIAKFSLSSENLNAISFSSLTGLNYLNLDTHSVSDISSISSLTNLTELVIVNDDSLSNISAIANLTNLTRLWLYNNTSITNISPIQNLSNVTSLYLSNTRPTVFPATFPTWTNATLNFFIWNASSAVIDEVINKLYIAGANHLSVSLEYQAGTRTSASDEAMDWLLDPSTGHSTINVDEAPTTITDIDTDETVTTTQTNVILTGTGFRALQSTGKLILANSSTYSGATVTTTQSIDSWSDTSIQFDVTPGSLSAGTVYAFVTNKYGGVNSTGFNLTLSNESPTYGDMVLAAGDALLYYWPMQEETGTTSTATIGGVNLFLNGATPGETGKIGNAVSFDGVNDYGVTASNLSLSSHNKIVVEMLAYVNSFTTDDNTLFFHESYPGSVGSFKCTLRQSIFLDNTGCYVFLDSDFNGGHWLTPSVSSWHHLVYVYDLQETVTNKVKVYVDGQNISTLNYEYTGTGGSFLNGKLYIALTPTLSSGLNSKIEQIAIYSNLSENDILAHYRKAFSDLTFIDDVDTDETVTTTQTNVVLTGSNFGVTQGTGSLILANSSTYSGATVTSTQSIDTWSDTSIQFDVTPGSLSAGTVYAFVTNKYGGVNSTGYGINLVELLSPTASFAWSGTSGEKNFILQGTTGASITVDWGDSSSTIYTMTGSDVTCVHDYSGSSGTTTLSGDISNITFVRFNNVLSNISLANLSSLQTLYIVGGAYGSSITLDSISGLTTLRNLNVEGALVNHDISPISGLTGLQQLYVPENGITDITAVSNLSSLTLLTLNYNNISTIPSVLPAWTNAGLNFYNSNLNASEVDEILNKLYTAGANNLTISIGGTNGNRTSASDVALDWLLSTGASTVTRNETPTTITDIDTDETVTTTQTNVILTGTGFRALQSTGKLILANSSTYSGATVTSTQSIDTWSDTSIQFDVTPGSLSAGTVYAFVTNKYGGVNSTGFAITLEEQAGGVDLSAWTNYFEIITDASKIPADLADYPLYVDLSKLGSSHGFWDNINTNGYDIIAANSDGTARYPIEVVSVSTTAHTGELYFKVPVLDGDANQTFRIYYNNSAITTITNPTNEFGRNAVWSNGFSAVWHLEEDGSNNAGNYIDSTGNSHSATGVNMSANSDVTGKIGKAQEFDGSDRYLIMGTLATFPYGNSAFTVSSWIYTDAASMSDGLWRTPVFVGTANTGNGYFLIKENAAMYGGAWWDGVFQSDAITADTWMYFSSTYNSATATLYNNGTPTVSEAKTYDIIQNEGYIGNDPFGERWDGKLDEVRISSVARSANWISTEYVNQNDPSVGGFFNSISAQLPSGLAGYNKYFTITTNESLIPTDLTDYPVYFNMSQLGNSHQFWTDYDYATDNDLAVTDATGTTRYPLEVVYMDETTATKTGEIYFKVPALDGDANQTFRVYYDNDSITAQPAVDSTYGRNNVWTSNYSAVYHFQETSGVYADSNGGNDMTVSSVTSRTATGTFGGYAPSFGGSDYISAASSTDFNFTDYTIEGWVYPTDLDGFRTITARSSESDVSFSWYLTLQSNTLWNGTGYPDNVLSSGVWTTGVTSGWQNFTAIVDADVNYRLYRNAVESTPYIIRNALETAPNIGDVFVGKNNPWGENYIGLIDELRYSSDVKSDNWITTSYNNQTSSTFFSNISGILP